MIEIVKVFVFVVYGFHLSSAANVHDLPSYFPRCYADDPELGKCFLKATETARPYMKKGVPELNMPTIEPLFLPEVSVQQGTDAVNYKITMINSTVYGLGDYDFKEFNYDPKTLRFHANGSFKTLKLLSTYEIEGKILLAPITGKGNASFDIGYSSGEIDVKGELVKRGNEEYFRIVDSKINLKIGDGKVRFDGLFNGNEELSQATNRLLNEHSSELIGEVTPAIEQVVDSLIKRLMEGLFDKVPYRLWLPPTH